MSVDFLPVCDLLFNFVSVTFYFCDIAFDILVLKECYELAAFEGEKNEDNVRIVSNVVVPLVTVMMISLFTSQIVSLKWYIEDSANRKRTLSDLSVKDWLVFLVHLFQCSVLWRYTKLLIKPLALRNVKSEMRNLCILRMIHSLCQSIFFLLIQGHLVLTKLLEARKAAEDGNYLPQEESDSRQPMLEVHYISMSFNMINICWSLASFNKNIQRKDVEKLVLTWIGVVFQFFWRLGTVSSRCFALILYWSTYDNWILFVVALHWICVFVPLVVPNKIFKRDETVSYPHWILKCLLMSYIYNFCYLNLDKTKTKTRMALFYSLIIVENILLVCLWSVSIKTFTNQYSQQEKLKIFGLVIGSFVIGILFMLLYYKYFHATKLGPIETHEFSMKGRQTKLNFSNDICSSNGVNGGQNTSTMSSDDTQNHQVHHHQQAVFNCVLPHQMQGNTKKKKMPSILPPPPAIMTSSDNPPALGIKAKTPFWKEPLPMQTNLNESPGSHQNFNPGENGIQPEQFDPSMRLYYNNQEYQNNFDIINAENNPDHNLMEDSNSGQVPAFQIYSNSGE